jgi:hypothetical protein
MKISDLDFGGVCWRRMQNRSWTQECRADSAGNSFRQLFLARGRAFLGAVSKSRYVRAVPLPGGKGWSLIWPLRTVDRLVAS